MSRAGAPQATSAAPADADAAAVVRRGTAYGFGAYAIWGIFPLYFVLLKPAGPLEILAHRILWTLLLCLVVLAFRRDLRWLAGMVRQPRRTAAVGLAGTVIAVNWTVYTFAVLTGHVAEAALGYFLNPLVTVALGVLVLRERLRPAQWVAVGIGAVAAVYLTVDYGRPPWISLALAFSFATYGLLKKRLGVSMPALHGLTGETLLLAPAAIALWVWLGATGEQTFVGQGGWHTVALMSAGVATAVPLLLFAAAASRVPLVTIGLLQFVAPVLQLMCAVLLGEQLTLSRWVGFGIVWVALAVLTLDSVRVGRARRLARAAESAAV